MMMLRKQSILAGLLLILLVAHSVTAWILHVQHQYQQQQLQNVARTNRSHLFSTRNSQDEKQLLSPAAVSEIVFQTDQRPVILFDGVCNMCNNAVNIALDWDPRGNLRFAALQSDVGRALLETNGRRADDISSIVLVSKDGAYVKSDAILRITEALAPPLLPAKSAARLGQLLIPKLLRDLIYDTVADNRYQIMGKRDSCRLDSDGEFEDRFVKEELAYR